MTDSKGRKIGDRILAHVSPDRRNLLRVILGGAAGFSLPLLASFSLEGLRFEPAEAQTSNMPMDPNMGPTAN